MAGRKTGKIVKVAGPLIVAEGLDDAAFAAPVKFRPAETVARRKLRGVRFGFNRNVDAVFLIGGFFGYKHFLNSSVNLFSKLSTSS